ncbi:MAG: methyltransferase domain-containing protein [Candidatus Zixiibacteriota bacterium]
MNEEYVTGPEYRTYYPKLGGLRFRIAADLPVKSGMRILDVATGSAYFAMEVARRDKSLRITGIDIARTDIRNSKKNLKREGLTGRVEVLQMDATKMSFPAEEFDMAVNFTGLEDIHMTRGKAGVEQTFHQVARVIKPDSMFCLVVMPPDEMETQAQRTEVALFSYICNATWLTGKEYESILQRAGFTLVEKKQYYTGKKLTPEQAKVEIRFAIETDPKIYGVTTEPFEKVWAKFGQQIEEHGLGHYSKVVLMVARKFQL